MLKFIRKRGQERRLGLHQDSNLFHQYREESERGVEGSSPIMEIKTKLVDTQLMEIKLMESDRLGSEDLIISDRVESDPLGSDRMESDSIVSDRIGSIELNHTTPSSKPQTTPVIGSHPVIPWEVMKLRKHKNRCSEQKWYGGKEIMVDSPSDTKSPRPYSELITARSDSRINWQGVLRGQPMKAVVKGDIDHYDKTITSFNWEGQLDNTLNQPRFKSPRIKHRSSISQFLTFRGWPTKSKSKSNLKSHFNFNSNSNSKLKLKSSQTQFNLEPESTLHLKDTKSSNLTMRRRQIVSTGNLTHQFKSDDSPKSELDSNFILSWKANAKVLTPDHNKSDSKLDYDTSPAVSTDSLLLDTITPRSSSKLEPLSTLKTKNLFSNSSSESSLNLQLKISQLKLQLEVTRKQLRIQQIANKDLQASNIEREIKLTDRHQMELIHARSFYSHRMKELLNTNTELLTFIENSHLTPPFPIDLTKFHIDPPNPNPNPTTLPSSHPISPPSTTSHPISPPSSLPFTSPTSTDDHPYVTPPLPSDLPPLPLLTTTYQTNEDHPSLIYSTSPFPTDLYPKV